MAQTQGALLAGYSFMALPVTGDKAQNVAPLAGQAMIGNVMIVEADWNDMFLTEVTGFPTGSHDDIVDAAGQAFKGFMKTSSGILDYYTRQVEAKNAAAAEQAGKPIDGVTHSTTTDLSLTAPTKRP
jgi:hypothetical protein